MRSASPLWSILHAPGFVLNTPEHVVFVAYPLIPWIGVTAVGYGLGQVYGWSADRRRAFLLRLGAALSLAHAFWLRRVVVWRYHPSVRPRRAEKRACRRPAAMKPHRVCPNPPVVRAYREAIW